MAIFIIQAEKIIGATKIRLIDEINEIFIIWSRDIDQEANIVLDVNSTVGANVIIHNCFDTSDNVWKTETQPINNKIPSQTINITRQEQNTIISSFEKTSDYIDAEIQKITQSISSIDTTITADKVMSVIENTPNSTIFAFAENNKLYFQSNELDYNIQYVDADFTTVNYTFETLTTCVTSAATYVGALNPETSYVYVLRNNFDILFYDVKFGAFRAVEYWALKDGTTDTFTQKYKYLFACNLSGENLSEDFINVKFVKCIAQCASPSFNDDIFGTKTTPVFNTNGASTNIRATIKYPTTCFRIKLNNFPIIAFPLTTSRVVSSVTAVNLDNFSFFVNNSSFLFCNRTEIDKMYNYINQENIINWHEASNQTIIFDEDILDGQIYNLYLTNNNPESQTVANSVDIKIAFKYLQTPKSFTLRLIVNIGLQNKTINLIDNRPPATFPDPISFTYITNSNNPIEFIDIVCTYKKVLSNVLYDALSLKAPKILKDITYYDWVYKQGIADKASLMRVNTTINPLTAAQYAQFNANRPIKINQTINGGETLILQNLKMYYLRGNYGYKSTATSSTYVYQTTQYKDNCTINITIDTPVIPSLVILEKVAFQNVRPVGNNKMFPLTTASTTNYKYSVDNEPLKLKINNTDIFSLTNTNTYKDYVFSWKRTVIFHNSQLLCIASPLTDVENGTIEPSTQEKVTISESTISSSIQGNGIIFVRMNFSRRTFFYINLPSFVDNPQFNATFKLKIRFAIYSAVREVPGGYVSFIVRNSSGFETSTYITYTSPSNDISFYNGVFTASEYVEFELTFTANGLTTSATPREKWIVNITQAIKSW